MFDAGLVFRSKALVNYCPSCKVVLSNEDSQGGKCDICHSDVIQKSKDVWYLRITEYADKLLEGLDHVDYPANIKQQQVNWIGKSTGAFVNFTLDGVDEKLEIYTTRPDTLFGVTFMVMAPEHPLIDKYADRISNMEEVKAYRAECAKKTEFERTQLVKDKTGVKLSGLMAVNPVNGKKIPIFIADYVMMGYGTGAIMAVPAHDQRDYEFAKAHGVEIIEVIKGGDISKEAYAGDGEMVNSDTFSQRYEAENAYLSSCSVEYNSSASSGRNVGYIQEGSTITFTVLTSEDTDFFLRLAVSNYLSSNEPLSPYLAITINSEQLSLANKMMVATSSWTRFSPCEIGVIGLKEGINSITVTCLASSTFNLDYLEIYSSDTK